MRSLILPTWLITFVCPTVLATAIPSEHLSFLKRTNPEEHHRQDGYKNTPTSRECWNDDLDITSDMDLCWPETGKVVKYHFDITNETMGPDGFVKPMMVINGQYPGPTVVADWGDEIRITVSNHLELNGTGIHWHGLRQLGTTQNDGVGGITECPIAPGSTRVYVFRATQYGSSWYHSHYSVQYGDGIVGGIQINGPATANYDIDLGTFPITDWFHTPLFTVNAAALHSIQPPTADNVLVNGTMTSAHGGQYGVTTLTPGKKHRLRLINTGINNYVHVAVDGHPFEVIAADFVPIVPYKANSVVLAVGQRYDIIIDANQPVDNYWLRVGTGADGCDGPNANAANIRSIMRYEGASIEDPKSTGEPLPTGCYDEVIVPFVKTDVPQELPEKLTFGFTQTEANDNLVQWNINASAMLVDYLRPTLQHVVDGNWTYNLAENVYHVGEADKWQYWVIQQDTSTPPLPHPIHLHGHDFYVLDHQAYATWSGDISRLIMNNPIRRDTATLPALGYLVLAFESDNPGTWLMHCHIPFHISAGLGLQFVERQDEILETIGDLSDFNEGCESWTTYQTAVYPNGFEPGDSGLKKRHVRL